jgi:hypothetical protein
MLGFIQRADCQQKSLINHDDLLRVKPGLSPTTKSLSDIQSLSNSVAQASLAQMTKHCPVRNGFGSQQAPAH